MRFFRCVKMVILVREPESYHCQHQNSNKTIHTVNFSKWSMIASKKLFMCLCCQRSTKQNKIIKPLMMNAFNSILSIISCSFLCIYNTHNTYTKTAKLEEKNQLDKNKKSRINTFKLDLRVTLVKCRKNHFSTTKRSFSFKFLCVF